MGGADLAFVQLGDGVGACAGAGVEVGVGAETKFMCSPTKAVANWLKGVANHRGGREGAPKRPAIAATTATTGHGRHRHGRYSLRARQECRRVRQQHAARELVRVWRLGPAAPAETRPR